ncbi:hypothetical protein [Variovorax paradoxus]|uniref:hypothetical protein n=1 Tax=Variovorax paradoxus TaxID=34073 RepID=UPI0029C649B2|nr:hypothetical protein RZE77_28650 [Variovorax paradoxus]
MPQITLASMQDCINAAFAAYDHNPPTVGTINVNTTNNGVVPVTCSIQAGETLFNCGTDPTGNYSMPAAQANNLRIWCQTHPGGPNGNWSYGFRGPDPTHPNQAKVTLINWNAFMFNFHVVLS